MSHFSVMVLGPDPEKQLAPYHEYECTGEDNEFVVNVDITADVKKRIADGESLDDALGYHGLEDRIVAREEDVLRNGRHSKKYAYGYAVVVDGNLVKAIDRTNPEKRWDWYVLGGRFSRKLIRKDGTTCDQSPLYDVDVEKMRDERERAWRARHRRYGTLTAGLPRGQTWKATREKHGNNIDAAREEYNAQRIVAAFRADNDFAFGGDPIEEFSVTEDEYAARARASALSMFALVKDGKWYERGSMGWWGCVSDEKAEGEWNSQVSKLLDGLPGETLVSIYDCHI